VRSLAGLSQEDVEVLKGSGGITFDEADRMVENVIGTFSFPLG